MAILTFTLDEALGILRVNGIGGENVKKIKADRDGLLLAVAGGINLMVRRESFSNGILKLALGSNSWAFKLADKAGMVDKKIDEAIRDRPFFRREGKSLFIDLNHALQSKVKGISIKSVELSDGLVRIEF
jgi:hypothetical protein